MSAAFGKSVGVIVSAALAFAFVIGFIEPTDPLSARVAAAIAALAAAFSILLAGEVLLILRGRAAASSTDPVPKRRALESERFRLLAEIRELDFDHAMGKIDEWDHRKERVRMEAAAIRAIENLERDERHYRSLAEELAAAQDEEPRSAKSHTMEEKSPETDSTGGRVSCGGCSASNEMDGAFCNACGEKLGEVR